MRRGCARAGAVAEVAEMVAMDFRALAYFANETRAWPTPP
jgi:hypothetical protein